MWPFLLSVRISTRIFATTYTAPSRSNLIFFTSNWVLVIPNTLAGESLYLQFNKNLFANPSTTASAPFWSNSKLSSTSTIPPVISRTTRPLCPSTSRSSNMFPLLRQLDSWKMVYPFRQKNWAMTSPKTSHSFTCLASNKTLDLFKIYNQRYALETSLGGSSCGH